MEIKKGIAVSPGISIARSLIIDSEDYRIPRRLIESEQQAAEVLAGRGLQGCLSAGELAGDFNRCLAVVLEAATAGAEISQGLQQLGPGCP